MKGVFLVSVLVLLLLIIPNVNSQKPEPEPIENIKIDVIDTRTKDIHDIVKTLDTKIDIYGTEYQVGDDATVFLQLTYHYLPINNGSCYIDVYYPNKTIFLNETPMYYLMNSQGIYYKDFVVPNVIGVYIVSAICEYPFKITSQKAYDYNLIYGNTAGGDYTDTWFLDGDTHNTKEGRDNSSDYWRFNFTYLFSFVEVNKSKIYRAEWEVHSDWYKDGSPKVLETENVYLKGYNFNTSSWFILGEAIPSPKNSFAVTEVIRTIEMGEYPPNYFNDSMFWFGFSDTNQSEMDMRGQFRIDYLTMKLYEMEEAPYEVIGSAELHVSNISYSITTDLKDFILAMQDVIDPVETFCENNTLVTETTRIYNINNRQVNITDEERINCTYGCVNNSCVLPPYLIWLIIIIVIVLVMIIYYYFSKETG